MGEVKYLKLNDIEAYKIAFHLSNYIWDIVIQWDFFAQKTIGAQFVDAADSTSANIAEGFGRWGKKDKIKFYRYSQGSRKECYDWNEKSRYRNLITEEQYLHIFQELEKLGPAIGRLIKFTNEKLAE
ncbi:MAG: four helix bundle protein [Saprospiraceae bacterium]|nr:four helix bundle protein [Saprospiraceae bacterium]